MRFNQWKKSSRSAGSACCVEVLQTASFVFVRHSKAANDDRVNLRFSYPQWDELITTIKRDEATESGHLDVDRDGTGCVFRSDDSAIQFSLAEWAAFEAGTRLGEFDLDV